MKTPAFRLHSIGPSFVLALVLALALWSPVPAKADDSAKEKPMKMMACCKDMTKQHDKLMEEMKAQDTELISEVAQMNKAPDDQKLKLLAVIVTHIAEQRAAMDEKMGKMQDKMMKHMMKHAMAAKEEMDEHSTKHDMDEKAEDEKKD